MPLSYHKEDLHQKRSRSNDYGAVRQFDRNIVKL